MIITRIGCIIGIYGCTIWWFIATKIEKVLHTLIDMIMLKVLFKCFSSFTEYLWEFFWIYDEFLVLNIFNKRKIYGIEENERKEVETNPNLVLKHFFASFVKHKSEVFPSLSKSKRTTTVIHQNEK